MTIRTVLGAPFTKSAPPYATFPGEERVPEVEPQAAQQQVEGEYDPSEPEETYDPGMHTVDEVKQYVTEHPDQAETVLAAEVAGKNRSTLITWLEEQQEEEAQTEGPP